MKTSILNILKKELIGKEIKIYKYNWGSAAIYNVEDLSSSYEFIKYEYAKITDVEFDLSKFEDIAIVLSVEKSDVISINDIYIKNYSTLELKEKED
jgi:hypothetical protein